MYINHDHIMLLKYLRTFYQQICLNSGFTVQNDGMCLPQIMRETCSKFTWRIRKAICFNNKLDVVCFEVCSINLKYGCRQIFLAFSKDNFVVWDVQGPNFDGVPSLDVENQVVQLAETWSGLAGLQWISIALHDLSTEIAPLSVTEKLGIFDDSASGHQGSSNLLPGSNFDLICQFHVERGKQDVLSLIYELSQIQFILLG